jgi:hypothetical protein
VVNGVRAEPGSPPQAGRAVSEAVRDLASFAGANEVEYPGPVPAPWARHLA